jgi:hypothetical protein
MKCAVCGKTIVTFDPEVGPFCGDRCRQLDLGRWLDERYTFPTERDPQDQDEADEPNGDGHNGLHDE